GRGSPPRAPTARAVPAGPEAALVSRGYPCNHLGQLGQRVTQALLDLGLHLMSVLQADLPFHPGHHVCDQTAGAFAQLDVATAADLGVGLDDARDPTGASCSFAR